MSVSPAIVQAMQRASALLQAGNFLLARATLEQVVQMAPRFVEAHRLLAGALQALGDNPGAEKALRTAVAIDPGWAPAQAALGELLANSGRLDEAERALRLALASGRSYPRAALALALLLNKANRAQDVLDVTASFAAAAQADPDLLTQRAVAFAALERHDDAIALYRRIAGALPDHAGAELNLAAALEAAGQHREAESTARSAITKGANSPEAHFVHARALIASNRFDEAEVALREILRQRPTFVDAQQNLAQLIWMRSGDLAAASEHLDATLRTHPDDDALHAIKAILLDGAGDARAAYAWLAERARRPAASVNLLLAAGQAASKFDPQLAHELAQRAVQSAPAHALANRLLAESLLGLGAADEAQQLVERLLRTTPDDQYLIALQTTVWRLRRDTRYAEFCDYARMARSWIIDTPPGWSDLASYLRDLSASLKRLHALHTHPLTQSLRHGSQTTQNLQQSDDPAIRAFFHAIDGPIQRHIETIGSGADPLRLRNAGTWRIKGIWSVRLRTQGYHTNHVHPQGWLSSACYIELPTAVLATPKEAALNHPGSVASTSPQPSGSAAAKQGWLKFGEPGIATVPPLAPEYFIRPEPGLLALFPSYFWHGTVPFGGDDTRLSIAFDLVPRSN
jgi:tetratricopeptide (TPR) repeat protein